jgi:hypothetical protein
VWTAHVRPGAAPVLVREGFSWAALLFGPLWLLARRAWIAAILLVAVSLAGAFLPGLWGLLAETGLTVAVGLFGHDMWRWSLARRGFLLTEVVAAPDQDTALARLLERRPDLLDAAVTEATR